MILSVILWIICFSYTDVVVILFNFDINFFHPAILRQHFWDCYPCALSLDLGVSWQAWWVIFLFYNSIVIIGALSTCAISFIYVAVSLLFSGRELWSLVFFLFGVRWVMPSTVVALFACWKAKCGCSEASKFWKSILLCLMWIIWRERNNWIWRVYLCGSQSNLHSWECYEWCLS